MRERCIDYSCTDRWNREKQEFQVKYEQITNHRRTHKENIRLDFLIISCVVIFVNLFLSFSLDVSGENRLLVALLIVTVIAISLYLRTSKITAIQTQVGEIRVIDDRQESIVQQIYERRNNHLFETYGKINWNNDPIQEIAKFRWLADLKVITEDQLASYILELERK